MQYRQLYNNHPMMYNLAKTLAKDETALVAGSAGADAVNAKETNTQHNEHKASQRLIFNTINLLGLSLSQGHVCTQLSAAAGQPALSDFGLEDVFPEVSAWLAQIQAWPFVHTVTDRQDAISEDSAFVLHGDKFYLNKYYVWEGYFAKTLLNLAERQSDAKVVEQGDGFNATTHDEIDWQTVAVNNSLLSPLSIVVGGPGTGKTTTVAKILTSILTAENNTQYRIALAAPTGKAAAKMALALHQKIADEDLPAPLMACVPEQAQTLHRLLGWSQQQRQFRFNASNLLPVNCVIVDEVSMIDIAMFVALLDALPPNARIILLGDPYQLASVQAGNVLSDICSGAVLQGFSIQRQTALGLTGIVNNAQEKLADNVVLLKKSYRFVDDAGIGLLAKACLAGDEQALNSALQQPEVQFLNKQKLDDRHTLTETMLKHHQAVAAAESIEQAFNIHAQFQLLCASKKGDNGTEFYNQSIQQSIPWQHSLQGEPIYHGMPVMMQSNHYQLGLFNGDLGLLWEVDGQLYIYFQSSDSDKTEMKRFLPSQIQGWQCAHAITVHKSQGSEYESVALVMPDRDSPLLSREMFYTAITRAKKQFTCLANRHEMDLAVRQETVRFSGLRERLV